MQLSNKVCLIAGASGVIGTAVAKLFHEQGARLALTHRSQEFRSAWANREGNCMLTIPLDVRNREETEAVVRNVVEHFGTIDVLVNCTGILGPIGPTVSISPEEWIETIS